MSYSYIKTVFPNFESSKNEEILQPQIPIPKQESNTITIQTAQKNETRDFSKQLDTLNQLEKHYTPFNYQTQPQNENVNVNVNSVTNLKNEGPFKDNLKFYNLPLPQLNKIETFETPKETLKVQNTPKDQSIDCDIYTKHVLECSKCKGILMKQFGIENDKIRNEEIMEVISYFIFALFILLLIDSLKK